MGNSYYQDGQNWISGMVQAALTLRLGDEQRAAEQAWAADCILAPLGEEDDPEAFRDFISGAANASEDLLRRVGVPLVADGDVPAIWAPALPTTLSDDGQPTGAR